MNKSSDLAFKLLAVFMILGILGPIAALPIFLELFLSYSTQLSRVWNAAWTIAQQKELQKAREKRRTEIGIVAASVSTRLEQITANEIERLNNARSEAQNRHVQDVETIASLVIRHVLEAQEKYRQEQEERIREALEEEYRQREMLERERFEQETRQLMPAVDDRDQRLIELRRAIQDIQLSILPADLKHLDPLDSGFTCIGTTLKGCRCGQFMIAGIDKAEAARTLQRIRFEDATDDMEQGQLSELANLMLCPRWHRDKKPQGWDISRAWYEALRPVKVILPALNRAREALEALEAIEAAPERHLLSYPYTPSSDASSPGYFRTRWSSPNSITPSSASSVSTSQSQTRSIMSSNPGRNLTPLFGDMARRGN